MASRWHRLGEIQDSVCHLIVTCQMPDDFRSSIASEVQRALEMSSPFVPPQDLNLVQIVSAFVASPGFREKHLFLFGHYDSNELWLSRDGHADDECVHLYSDAWMEIFLGFCHGQRQFIWISGCDGANADAAVNLARQRAERSTEDEFLASFHETGSLPPLRKAFIRRIGCETDFDGFAHQGLISTSTIIDSIRCVDASFLCDLQYLISAEGRQLQTGFQLKPAYLEKYDKVTSEYERFVDVLKKDAKAVTFEVELHNWNGTKLIVIKLLIGRKELKHTQVHTHFVERSVVLRGDRKSEKEKVLWQTGPGLYIKLDPWSRGKLGQHCVVEDSADKDKLQENKKKCTTKMMDPSLLDSIYKEIVCTHPDFKPRTVQNQYQAT